uniref:Uncharacterized protein n=1 Tax=Lutzomyia longipalpis TaxID=7200 RepID=A0A1B0CP28_LUTLO
MNFQTAPKKLKPCISPLSSNSSNLLPSSVVKHCGHFYPQNVASLSQQSANAASIVAVTPPPAPPPPYHIAILLPENSKDVEESPPPAYDKIVI